MGSDILKPLGDLTAEEWRTCAAFHEENNHRCEAALQKLREVLYLISQHSNELADRELARKALEHGE